MPDTWYIRRGAVPESSGSPAPGSPASIPTDAEGPLPAAELKVRAADGRLTRATVVSPNGADWVPAGEVDGLFPDAPSGQQPRPPTPDRWKNNDDLPARPAVLMFHGLRHRWRPEGPDVLAVDDFKLLYGEHLALSGPSGTGKSTLLNIAAGLLTPTAGTVKLDMSDLSTFTAAQRDRFRGSRVGIVFQTFNLVQSLSAEDNVRLAMTFGPLPPSGHRDRARELLRRVDLADHAGKRPAELSVGQQQRVAVARALANKPKLVLADEPAANLDKSNAKAVAALLREVCDEAGAALLVAAHDEVMLAAMPRVVDIARFRPAEAGKPPG